MAVGRGGEEEWWMKEIEEERRGGRVEDQEGDGEGKEGVVLGRE